MEGEREVEEVGRFLGSLVLVIRRRKCIYRDGEVGELNRF